MRVAHFSHPFQQTLEGVNTDKIENLIRKESGYVSSFERFNAEARRALQYAHEEAHRLGHNSIGTAHLLLGLVCDPQCVAARALRAMQLDLATIRRLARRSGLPLEEKESSSEQSSRPIRPAARRLAQSISCWACLPARRRPLKRR